jgi:hypothetical protein
MPAGPVESFICTYNLPMNDSELDQLIKSDSSMLVSTLCHHIGPCELSKFLEQHFDPHYPFRKTDQEKLFGMFSLSIMRSLGREVWFDFRYLTRIQISLEHLNETSFCVGMDRITKRLVILIAKYNNSGEKAHVHHRNILCRRSDDYYVFSYLGEGNCALRDLISILTFKKMLPMISSHSLAFRDSEFVRHLLFRIKMSLSWERPETYCQNFIWMESFLEHYFVLDPEGQFGSRNILKGTIIPEIFCDLAPHYNANMDVAIVKWKKNHQCNIIRKILAGPWCDAMWAVGCGNMACLPRDLVGLIRVMLTRTLFI